jgi:hypothetical protein
LIVCRRRCMAHSSHVPTISNTILNHKNSVLRRFLAYLDKAIESEVMQILKFDHYSPRTSEYTVGKAGTMHSHANVRVCEVVKHKLRRVYHLIKFNVTY